MSLYKKAYDIFSAHYLGYAMIGVLTSSCLGAGAAMLALQKGHGFWEMFQVGLLVIVCMIFNATILSDRKHSIVFNWGLASVVCSSVLLIMHILF